jgi:putative transposase
MLMQRGYKYKLYFNNKERTSLQKCARTARFAWNWALAERNDCSDISNSKGMYGIIDAMKQHKLLNTLKKTNFPWMYDVSIVFPRKRSEISSKLFRIVWREKSVANLQHRKARIGFLKFKKKNTREDSFRLTGSIKMFPHYRKNSITTFAETAAL